MMIFLFNIVLPISNSNISIPNHFNWKESDPDFKANTKIIERYDNLNSFNFSNGGAVSCYDTKMTTFSSCLSINNFLYGYQSAIHGRAICMDNSIISFSFTNFINNTLSIKSK